MNLVQFEYNKMPKSFSYLDMLSTKNIGNTAFSITLNIFCASHVFSLYLFGLQGKPFSFMFLLYFGS